MTIQICARSWRKTGCSWCATSNKKNQFSAPAISATSPTSKSRLRCSTTFWSRPKKSKTFRTSSSRTSAGVCETPATTSRRSVSKTQSTSLTRTRTRDCGNWLPRLRSTSSTFKLRRRRSWRSRTTTESSFWSGCATSTTSTSRKLRSAPTLINSMKLNKFTEKSIVKI